MKDNKILKKGVIITLSVLFIIFTFAFIAHLSKPYVFDNKIEVYRDQNNESLTYAFDINYLTNAYEDIEVNYVILTDDMGNDAYVQVDNQYRYYTNTLFYNVNRLIGFIDISLRDNITYDFKKMTVGFSDNSIIEKDLDYFKIIDVDNDSNNRFINFFNYSSLPGYEEQEARVQEESTLLSIESELYNQIKDYTNISFNNTVYKDPFDLELSENSILTYQLKFDRPTNLKEAYTTYVFDLKLNFEEGVQYIYDNKYTPDYDNFFNLFKLTKMSGGK